MTVPDSSQADFQARWPTLRDPHVRALAWLLDAPDLMAPDAPCWEGRIASLGRPTADTVQWLQALDSEPAQLQAFHAYLAQQPSGRLGRYAEKLLTYFLQHQGWLVAANLQVRNLTGGRETLGEFDFLVRLPDGDAAGLLSHWEFATKFYLLEEAASEGLSSDIFVGPNLADSLGKKMRKIMTQQLQLSRHPAAAPVLPEPVAAAQALVKGWLFYRDPDWQLPAELGISPEHCRGFWCTADDLLSRYADQSERRWLALPRLAWLAPARVSVDDTLGIDAFVTMLRMRLAQEQAPVIVASCLPLDANDVVEVERGFIVPDDWQQRAAEGLRHAVKKV